MAIATYFPDVLNKYDFSGTYLFDTNVWVFIQGPHAHSSDRRTQIYSRLLKVIMDHGGKVVINQIVILEFVKVFISIVYNAAQTDKTPKEFRQTEAYREIAEAIPDEVYQLLQNCDLQSCEFSGDDYERVAQTLADGALEYNDGLLVEICKREKLTLVTDDYDFANTGIPVLSANRKYKA